MSSDKFIYPSVNAAELVNAFEFKFLCNFVCLCFSGDQCYRTRLPFAPPPWLPCPSTSVDVGLLAERARVPPPILWPRKLSWQAYPKPRLPQTHNSLTGQVSDIVVLNQKFAVFLAGRRNTLSFHFNVFLFLYSFVDNNPWNTCELDHNFGLKNFLLKNRVFLITVLNLEALRHWNVCALRTVNFQSNHLIYCVPPFCFV